MAIDTVVEEVAANLDEAAAATRAIDTRALGCLVGGIAVGFAVGFYFGYRFNREKLRAEAFQESEKEVEKIRETYADKVGITTKKPPLEEIVEERGYESTEVKKRPLRPVVPIREETDGWNYAVEIQGRDPYAPYVIHQDEMHEKDDEGYSHVAYSYYSVDDVLCDEDDRPLPHAQEIIGKDNLKFGHGTDDPDVVFVRNDQMQLVMEICRTPRSYEEDVLGHDHAPGD